MAKRRRKKADLKARRKPYEERRNRRHKKDSHINAVGMTPCIPFLREFGGGFAAIA